LQAMVVWESLRPRLDSFKTCRHPLDSTPSSIGISLNIQERERWGDCEVRLRIPVMWTGVGAKRRRLLFTV